MKSFYLGSKDHIQDFGCTAGKNITRSLRSTLENVHKRLGVLGWVNLKRECFLCLFLLQDEVEVDVFMMSKIRLKNCVHGSLKTGWIMLFPYLSELIWHACDCVFVAKMVQGLITVLRDFRCCLHECFC